MYSREMLTLSILRNLHTNYVGFFLSYTQADVKSEIFMEIPKGFGVEEAHPRSWIVSLNNNLYVRKDSGVECFENIKEVMGSTGYVQFQVYPCGCYR